ncbi:MAG: helix-turn-helix domain-containing protein [Campylobacterales bacterium]|nr:helix-turn-helix domain-containing protein [Campylobacterales bacterium]
MKTLFEIVEQIKDVVCEEFPGKKVFDKDVASLLGISQMNFATMKKRNKIPFHELLDFCARRSIAINWLLYGQAPESLIEPTNRFYRVRYFTAVNASAGGGAENDDEVSEPLMLEAGFVALLGGEQELRHIEAINVSGDSMEPLFQHGDIVFINRSKQDIGRGGVFTINTEHGLFIKRIQKRIDGRIDIISDNKDYPLHTAHPSEVQIIGRVVGRFGGVV